MQSGSRIAILWGAALAAALGPRMAAAQTEAFDNRREVMASQYLDDLNQQVSTLSAKNWWSLTPGWRLGVKALGEWIRIPGPETGHSGHSDPHAGHHDPGGASSDIDAVSGASIVGHGHHGSGEGRGEGTLSLRRDWQGANPVSMGISARYSGESDYHSAMATLSGAWELFQRNTALSGYLGAGMDYSNPSVPPPGQSDEWPARSGRLALGVQAGQILSPRVQVGASYAFSLLAGTLENPYRRARVITTLFPERLPDTRLRHVGAAEIGGYLGFGVAAFHRQGGYIDSWGVRAWIPETALPFEIGERWLLTPRHKYYYQLPADFYRTHYPVSEMKGWITGDVRLGHLESQELALEVEYALRGGARSPAISLSASATDLTYLASGTKLRNYVISLGFRSPN